MGRPHELPPMAVSYRMFPAWEELLAGRAQHDGKRRPACEIGEAVNRTGHHFSGCPACVISQHAKATLDPTGEFYDHTTKSLTTIAEATNALIRERGLPLPLIPLDRGRTEA